MRSQNNLIVFADCAARSRIMFDFYHLQSPGLRWNDRGYSLSVCLSEFWMCGQNSEKEKNIDFTGRVTYCRKISGNADIFQIVCALSHAGFDTERHLKLPRRCSLKCQNFTFQSRILQVKKVIWFYCRWLCLTLENVPLQSHPVDRKVHSLKALWFSLAIRTPSVNHRHEIDRPAVGQKKK